MLTTSYHIDHVDLKSGNHSKIHQTLTGQDTRDLEESWSICHQYSPLTLPTTSRMWHMVARQLKSREG